MRKLFKLLTAVLVLGFLVGCGGGSSGDGDKISFAKIAPSFPAFDESGETVSSISSGKFYYPVSASQESTFIGALAGKGFIDGGSYYYKIDTDYTAYADSYSGEIDLTLISLTIPHTDAQYASIFGDLNADVDGAYISKQYTGDLTAKFNAYRDLLEANGWIITNPSNPWTAEKTIGSLTYDWYALAYGINSNSQWEIYK